jgi:primosomal protein N'
MEIVTVYPLAKGTRAETLDYYSPHELAVGTIVSIPFGNRTEHGVACHSQPAEKKRAHLRSAGYQLKPIDHAGTQKLLPEFIKAAKQFAAFSGATTGATIRSLTPQPVISHDDTKEVPQQPSPPDISAPPVGVIQAKKPQQLSYVESLTAKHTTNQESVYICAPTVRDCKQLADTLTAYDPVVLHSSLKPSTQRARWNHVATQKESVIVGTPPFLSVPATNLKQIIVYNESDSAYKMNRRPYLDKGRFPRYLAEKLRIDCTVTDTVLPTETVWAYENGDLTETFPPDFRRTEKKTTQLVDMNEHQSESASGVQVFSPEAVALIRSVKKIHQHIFLLVVRRGRRPFTICNDCGDILRCSQCGLPFVLKETKADDRVFVCHTCGNKKDSDTRCDNCNSWRMKPLGIGVDFVADILSEHTEDTPVFKVDADSHDPASQIQQFYDEDSGILIGTKSGITSLTEPIESSIVVTADALLAIPDLNISHELFNLLITLRDKTKNEFIIQTRNTNTDIFSSALAGDIRKFYETEISQRKQFDYPPFSYLIKLTIPENKTKDGLTDKLNQTFSDYGPQTYPARNHPNQTNMLLRIDRSDWVDDNLLAKLRDLPLVVGINAHPRSLL